MLEATFEFAKLALSNAILINGGAAAALIAFFADGTRKTSAGLYYAILGFAIGAGVGGLASILAYFGQRLDWAQATNRPYSPGLLKAALITAMLFGVFAYVLFFAGCFAAASSLRP
ncbi:MAG: hypothetical protein ABI885_17440 [Gammaproteobacteria bacterium]